MKNKEKELLQKIKKYIEEGIDSSVELLNGALLAGKIAAYNDVYDYITYILEEGGEENA